MVKDVIKNGTALIHLKEFLSASGANPNLVDDYSLLPQFKNEFEVKSKKSGWISKIEAEEVGKAAMVLGAGRETKEDVIDHSVGVLLKKKVGDYVEEGETLAIIQYNERNLQSSIKLLESAYTIIDEKVNKNNVILEIHAVNVL
ncbi:MAG: pyrimidine-nucleoside phosphorylase, partial [Cetobacterium sp.]